MANYSVPVLEGMSLIANAGIFQLLDEEANGFDAPGFSATNDKGWVGAQLGLDFDFGEDIDLLLAGTYYDFQNVRGRRNALGSNQRDWTAPEFVTKGNSVFNIANEPVGVDRQLYGLASDFELINVLTRLNYTGFGDVHVVVEGDYVKNIGFDGTDVSQRLGFNVRSENEGWGANLKVGSPKTDKAGTWQVFGGYRYVERDAVMDAFTDSDFHGGGTDAEGWIAGFNLGLTRNTWMRARYLSAGEIAGAPVINDTATPPGGFAPLDIDVVQVDLNAKF